MGKTRSLRTEISQRHDPQKRYEFAGISDGKATIRDRDTGLTAIVKSSWIDHDGIDCWAKSPRTASHIENAKWETKETV